MINFLIQILFDYNREFIIFLEKHLSYFKKKINYKINKFYSAIFIQDYKKFTELFSIK